MQKSRFKKTFIPIIISFIMILSQSLAFAQSSKVMKTPEKVDPKYTWNLEDVYKDQTAFQLDFDKQLKIIEEIGKYKDKLNEADNLLTVLKLNDEASIIDNKIYWYAHFMQDLDIEDSKAADLCAKTEDADNKLSTVTAYINPEIMTLSEQKLKECLDKPEYASYKHYLDSKLKVKKYILSKDNEELIAKLSKTSGDPENVFNNAIRGDWKAPVVKNPKGNSIKLDDAGYSLAMENTDRNFRKKAFETYYESMDKFKNTLSATLQASVNKDEVYATARGYKSALEQKLSENYVPESVFTSLIDTTNKNIPYLHKYYKLRAKAMKFDKVHAYDMNVPLVDPKIAKNMKYTIDKSYALILEALKPLGEEYVNGVKQGFENRWLDVYPRDRKATGGYNLGLNGVHPFVLLNYDGSIDETSTIAHEMGHAMHAIYSQKNQPYINSDAPIFTAEVASTANELILMDYMINNAKNDDEKLYLINKQIDNIRGTIYSQVMFSEFEKAIHDRVIKGESLSFKELSKTWTDIIKKYNGPSYEVLDVQGKGWMDIPHFYMTFYVYNYATSMSASYELVKQMKEDKTGEATKRYLEFLSAGNSEYPIDVLKKAGVDMTTPQPVENILSYFNSLVDQMESILQKQGKIK